VFFGGDLAMDFSGFSRPGRVQAGKDGLALERGNVE